MRLLAIDPGEMVGWATAEYVAPSPDLGPDRTGLFLDTHGITPLQTFALSLAENISKYDLVIYESYNLIKAKSREGEELQTSQLIGMIRLLAWLNDVKLKKQSPRIKRTADKSAKGVFKELIDAEPGTHDDAHDIDAIRHLWYWYFKKEVAHAKQA